MEMRFAIAMQCRKRTNLSCFLLLTLSFLAVNAADAIATEPCDLHAFRRWVDVVFNGRDEAQEFIARTLQSGKLKHFDFKAYFQAKEKFSELETLPPIPGRDHFEEHLAWLESAESRATDQVGGATALDEVGGAHALDGSFAQNLPTVEGILLHGTARQKNALARWSKKYGPLFDRKFSRGELAQASADLSLILHDSRLNLETLNRAGVQNLSQAFVETELHSKILEKGLIRVFGKSDLIRKDRLIDQVKRLLQRSGVKWPVNGAMNTAFFLSSRYLFRAVLITLPNSRIARISTEDMAKLLVEGFEKRGPEMAAKYAPKVRQQVFYNAVKKGVRNFSYLSLSYVAHQIIETHLAYEDQLDRQRHRTKPALSPSPSPSPSAVSDR